MTLCVNCGVELEDGLKICPLCGKDPENKIEQDHVSSNYPSGIIQLQKKETRRYLWELSGIIAFSGIVVCTILDLLTGKGLNWSPFSDVSLLTAWVIMTLYLFAYKRTYIIVTLQMLTILAALFFIDLFATGREWFFPVGLPVTVAAFIAAGLLILLYNGARFKGLNIIASAFVLLSGFCIISEIIFDKYRNGFLNLQWSLIVAVSVLPVALLLFFCTLPAEKGKPAGQLFSYLKSADSRLKNYNEVT